jgi:DNA polymerase-1
MYPEVNSLWDTYRIFLRPFGELLTDLESEGFLVDLQHLHNLEIRARLDQYVARSIFIEWICHYVPDAKKMNINSGPQIMQLLFGGYSPRESLKTNNHKIKENFISENVVEQQKPMIPFEREFIIYDTDNASEVINTSKFNKKMLLYSVWGKQNTPKIKPELFTETSMPKVSISVLRSLAGDSDVARDILLQMEMQRHRKTLFCFWWWNKRFIRMYGF